MKTRLVSLNYRGCASVDPRFSAAMLPWTINDIRSMENYTKLSVGIENGLIEAYNSDFELQFGHSLKHVVGMCRIIHRQSGKNSGNGYVQIKQSSSSSTSNGIKHHMSTLTSSASYSSLSSSSNSNGNSSNASCGGGGGGGTLAGNAIESNNTNATTNVAANGNPSNFMEFNGPLTGLVYLMKDPRDPLLHIYLFECDSIDDMAELMHQMRDPAHTLGGSVGSIPQTLVTTTTSSSGSDLSLQRALSGNGIHATPATNLKLSEAVRNASHDSSPNLISSKMKSSKSYTHGLSNSAGTVHIPTSTSAQANLSLLGDISPNHTHFFEVLYVGKIRVSHKRVPYSFIDDAIPKFKAYDAQRSRLLQMGSSRKMSLNSESSFESVSRTIASSAALKEDDGEYDDDDDDDNETVKDKDNASEMEDEGNKINDKNIVLINGSRGDKSPDIVKSAKVVTIVTSTAAEENKENKKPIRLMRGLSDMDIQLRRDGNGGVAADKQNYGDDENSLSPPNIIINNCPSPSQSPAPPTPPQLSSMAHKSVPTSQSRYSTLDNIPKQRDRSASSGCIPPYVEQNRTMVFLVGRSDLRLISPDRKQVLLYKDFKDVASCVQGQKNADHFGIICREGNTEGYIGYVFKCQSDHVCEDIVAAISQAFVTCSEQKKKEASQVFSCDHCPMLWYHKLCNDVDGLSEKKTQAMIFRRIESLTDDEQDTIWAKFYGSEKMSAGLSEQNQFLMMLLRAHCESRQQRHVHDTAENRSEFLNQYLGGSTIFMKAKRSLTNSFDHLLKRKASKDDIAVSIREGLSEANAGQSSGRGGNETPPDGFRSRSNTLGSSPNKTTAAEQLKSPMMDIFMKVGNSPKESEAHQGSWRQAILNSVVTPSKGMDNVDSQVDFMSPMRIIQQKRGKRTSEELRELWKTAIRQIILLNRMETENAMLQARQNENEMKRIKLDYEEIVPCDRQLIERWEMIIERDSSKITNKKDPRVLAQAIKNGVPRSKRGDVWFFLAEQHSMYTAPVDTKKFPNFNTPYHTLLKSLTEHQHAIFIDLGRTFPNHKYYKDPLGVGQLSLFNLLKAYSILDPELGYCQGLGFICGILLLHCDESDAFELLKHLMFRRQMRTKYLPDMKKFQLQLYQLSRLVKDHLPDLYEWLDENDVSPTLYAAPWILTVFSSQFPLGFVARVFDLLFLESPEVIFKFALALLTVHKDDLLARDNFEDIMDFLKTIVPKVETTTMETIMKMIFTMDITKLLAEYQVEYNVLQEEISTTNHHLEMLNREKAQNQHLETQLQFAQSSIAQLEKTRTSQQSQITTLQAQIQTLEVTIQTLGRFAANVVDRNVDVELPSDVRRILQQLEDIDRQRKKPLYTERKIGKSMSVNSHLGFPLKVLEELNEREESGSPVRRKIPFFEHTYEHLRQQQQRSQQEMGSMNGNNSASSNSSSSSTPSSPQQQQQQPQRPTLFLENSNSDTKADEANNVQKSSTDIKSPTEADSGVGTPLSPPPNSISSNGSIFSRIGYKTQPAILSPSLGRQLAVTQSSVESNSIVDTTDGSITNNNNNNNSNSNNNNNSKNNNNNNINTTNKSGAIVKGDEMHPLSMVGEVNVRFNGTTQLKSIRPMHHARPMTLATKVAHPHRVDSSESDKGASAGRS